MNISVLQENLARGLGTVSRAVATRATLPVLANVLMRTEEGGLKLTATNLEIGITYWVSGKVEDPGEITVPARLLTDLVSSLAPGKVDLELSAKDRSLKVTSGGSRASIKGIEADEFPVVGGIGDAPVTTVKARHPARGAEPGGLCGCQRRVATHPDRGPDPAGGRQDDPGRGRQLPDRGPRAHPGAPGLRRDHGRRPGSQLCRAGPDPARRGYRSRGHDHAQQEPDPVPRRGRGPGQPPDRGRSSPTTSPSSRARTPGPRAPRWTARTSWPAPGAPASSPATRPTS